MPPMLTNPAQIFAAISDCATGQNMEFSEKHYMSAYVENMTTIMHIKNDAPKEYHALMHRLFRQARCVTPCAVLYALIVDL